MIHTRIHLTILLLGMSLCFLSSCKDNDDVLNINDSQLTFTYEGGRHTIIVESNDDWSIYGLPEWLSASRISGINTQEVTLTALRNSTGLDREQTLSIRSNNSSNIRTIRVKQYANSEGQVFSVDDTSLKYFNGSTSNFEAQDSIILKSSVRWKITGPTWLSMRFKEQFSDMNGEIREGSGTIYLTCSKDYQGKEARKGTITIQTEYGDASIQIPVEQMGLYDVKCVNKHILSDGFWFYTRSGHDTEYIMSGLYEGIVSPEEFSTRQWSNPTSKTGGIFYDELKPETYYTIFTRAMPSQTTVFMEKLNAEVIRTASEVNQPRASITDVQQGADGKWHFKIVMNEQAKGYYYTSAPYTHYHKIQYAVALYNNIGTKNVGFGQTDKTVSPSYTSGTLVTWAVDENGKLSNVVDIYKFGDSGSSSVPVWQKQTGTAHEDIFSAGMANFEIPSSIN